MCTIRASRSNNFYLALLLTMLFLCVLPVGYAIVWIKPSWHCGPFSNHTRIHLVFTDTLRQVLPMCVSYCVLEYYVRNFIFLIFTYRSFSSLHKPLDYIASPSTVIPLLLLLILIIYYLISLTNALREANEDLKNQLRRERQEERRKMLQRVVTAKLDDSGNGNNAMDRWRKVLEASSPLTPSAPGQTPEPDDKIQARKELLARIMKKALRKSSNTSEDESHEGGGDDETDTEQHESLPHDQEISPEIKKSSRTKKSKHLLDDKKESKHVRKPSFARMLIDAAKKADQTAKEQSKPAKASLPDEVEQEKAPNAVGDADGEDLEEKVVSERRLLRRQQSVQSTASGSLPRPSSHPSEKEDVSYEVVNEKNKEVEKKAKQRIKVKTEPEIFKFDKHSLRKDKHRNDEREKDDASPKQKETERKKDKRTGMSSSSSSRSQSSSDNMSQLPHQSQKSEKRDSHARKRTLGLDSSAELTETSAENDKEPPHYASVIKPASEVSATKKTVSDISFYKKSDVCPSIDEEKAHVEVKKPTEKPIKKLSSFLALVREAVQKKQDQPPVLPPAISERPLTDITAQVKKYIDDSVSISEDGSTTKTSDSQSRGSATKQKRHAEPQKPKRQDSQTSIWSDNIPVITISKTESEECILEKSTDEAEDNFDEDTIN